MRRINSEFQTLHISEEGQKLSNRDYFGFVEMDDFACYVLADSLDEDPESNSARLVVESIIRDFTQAPSMRAGTLKRYLRRAHAELLHQRSGMHLKAAVVVAVTDYRKLRFCHVGNSRLYLVRNARILERTKDQSLTQNLLEQGQLIPDEAARHEERNNLYSFLGERGNPKLQVSGKKKLEDGDLIIQLTRGVWEQCGEQEFLQIVNDAGETKDILSRTEDFILKNQENSEIDNYSLALTSVNKVYRSPKKPLSVKKILMIALPVLLAVTIASVAVYMHYRSVRTKTESMRHEEADMYAKLAEQVNLSDEALREGEYKKAQELYLTARRMSQETGNIGLTYIEGQLDETEGYIYVFDLIAQGEKKEEYGNIQGAIALYKEAKQKAVELYFLEGKQEALELQTEKDARIQEQVEAQAVSKAMENEQKTNDQQNAIDLENQGNALLAEGSYESAVTFYQAAKAIYNRLELTELAEGIDLKIATAEAGAAAKAEKKAEEETQTQETEEEETQTETEEGTQAAEEDAMQQEGT